MDAEPQLAGLAELEHLLLLCLAGSDRAADVALRQGGDGVPVPAGVAPALRFLRLIIRWCGGAVAESQKEHARDLKCNEFAVTRSDSDRHEALHPTRGANA